MVKSAAEKALQALRDPTLKTSDKKMERFARLKEIVNPIFDYHKMARRCLGIGAASHRLNRKSSRNCFATFWKKLTPTKLISTTERKSFSTAK